MDLTDGLKFRIESGDEPISQHHHVPETLALTSRRDGWHRFDPYILSGFPYELWQLQILASRLDIRQPWIAIRFFRRLTTMTGFEKATWSASQQSRLKHILFIVCVSLRPPEIHPRKPTLLIWHHSSKTSPDMDTLKVIADTLKVIAVIIIVSIFVRILTWLFTAKQIAQYIGGTVRALAELIASLYVEFRDYFPTWESVQDWTSYLVKGKPLQQPTEPIATHLVEENPVNQPPDPTANHFVSRKKTKNGWSHKIRCAGVGHGGSCAMQKNYVPGQELWYCSKHAEQQDI